MAIPRRLAEEETRRLSARPRGHAELLGLRRIEAVRRRQHDALADQRPAAELREALAVVVALPREVRIRIRRAHLREGSRAFGRPRRGLAARRDRRLDHSPARLRGRCRRRVEPSDDRRAVARTTRRRRPPAVRRIDARITGLPLLTRTNRGGRRVATTRVSSSARRQTGSPSTTPKPFVLLWQLLCSGP